ncbi:hypothetical protein EJ04DRAFT_584161, partial [Polyplosphaeria fusca]
YGETAYSEVRTFVVIQNKGTFSQCVPVHTYRSRGATKPGLVVQDHGMIYTAERGDDAPALEHGEAITKQPIRVNCTHVETLLPTSRINYSRAYAVEHNCKVLEIGTVAPEHIHLLQIYFEESMRFL